VFKEDPMFNAWKQEKATAALVDAAQDLSDKLRTAKPHFVESYAANARLWAAVYLAQGQDLLLLSDWSPAARVKFVAAAQTKIAALRKARDYDSSDGLTVWLHTARAVIEPRVAPAAREIWQHLDQAGQNADAMALDLLQEAGLPADLGRPLPKGFATAA
jgi:hypothetical protein